MTVVNKKAKGSDRERRSKRLLKEDGWVVTKAGASLGEADLVALKGGVLPTLGGRPVPHGKLLVQVKAAPTPWKHFGPAERLELIKVAKRAGAIPVLAHWRNGSGKHTLLWPDEWPDSG